MTREEAKELLIHVLMTYEPRDQYGDLDDSEPYEEAMTMAIEALRNCSEIPNGSDIKKTIQRGLPVYQRGWRSMTNADVIRKMTDEQLYEFLSCWEQQDIDYAVTFCDLCEQGKREGGKGNFRRR